jgi:hypothetical protein
MDGGWGLLLRKQREETRECGEVGRRNVIAAVCEVWNRDGVVMLRIPGWDM